jgi:hypothetical protein
MGLVNLTRCPPSVPWMKTAAADQSGAEGVDPSKIPGNDAMGGIGARGRPREIMQRQTLTLGVTPRKRTAFAGVIFSVTI